MDILSEEAAILLGCYLAGEDGLHRTKLQKILYFASQKEIFKDSFGRGYYGPFSSEVANHMESLVSANFLRETLDLFPGGRGYIYPLSRDGEKIIPELKGQTSQKLVKKLSKIIELCRDQTVSSISIAAKVHYILKRMDVPMTAKEIAKHAEKMDWNISPDKVVKSARLLKELKLIK
jgi:uncharacterized protein YwgA